MIFVLISKYLGCSKYLIDIDFKCCSTLIRGHIVYESNQLSVIEMSFKEQHMAYLCECPICPWKTYTSYSSWVYVPQMSICSHVHVRNTTLAILGHLKISTVCLEVYFFWYTLWAPSYLYPPRALRFFLSFFCLSVFISLHVNCLS